MDFWRAVNERPIPFTLLEDLVNPYCGSRFEVDSDARSSEQGLSDGILRCECYEYPVVSGIAVLRQMSPVATTRNVAVDYLKKGDSNGALQWLLENGSATGVPGPTRGSAGAANSLRILRRVRDVLREKCPPLDHGPIPLHSGFQASLHASRPRGYAEYLFHRYANASLLGAIPPLLILGDCCRDKSPGRVLDLLCGVGHTSALLTAFYPELEVVMADSDFVNLFLARNFTAPQATALCVDAEAPLPFAGSSFCGLFCLDGLHYVRSKVALLREADRVLGADGVWAFAHMHNASAFNENPGAPLTVDGYRKLFAFGPNRLMAESEVLRQFQTQGCMDLTTQPDSQSLPSSHALTLVGGRTDSLWKRHSDIDETLCRRPDRIGLNPIYDVADVPDGLVLTAAWPSQALRQECIGRTPALPESVCIPRHVVDEIAAVSTTATVSDNVRALLRSFVLTSLPDCYSRLNLIPGA